MQGTSTGRPPLGLKTILLLGIAAASGCSAPLPEIRAPKPEQTVTEAWNSAHEAAASDLACSIGGLTTKEVSNHDRGTYTSKSFKISGCGKTEIFLIQQHTATGDHRWTVFSDHQLRTNLQFTLGGKCPTWTVEFIDDATRGVTFCGQKAVYILGPEGWTAQMGESP